MAQKEFEKVEGQIEYYLVLITTRKAKLFQLELKHVTQILNVLIFVFRIMIMN